MHAHETTSTMLNRWGCICSFLFSTLLLSHHLDKVSSLSHRSSKTLLAHLCAFLQTLILPFYCWCWSEVCILLCSICNYVWKSPEDSKLSEHHRSFLEVVGDFTVGFIFTAFMICLSQTTVVFLSQSGQCWLLVSLDIPKLLIYLCHLFLL